MTDEAIKQTLQKLLEGQTAMKEELGKKIDDVAKTVTEVQNEVKVLKRDTTNKFTAVDADINSLCARVIELENKDKVRERENELSALRNDMYNKRFNILILGKKDTGTWETRSQTLKTVRDILKDGLKLPNADTIPILDAHRLPQNPLKGDTATYGLRKTAARLSSMTATSSTRPRPIIFKVSSAFDLDTIWRSVSNLKAYNLDQVKRGEPKISLSKHLPRALQKQKEKLKEQFKEAKDLGKRVNWRIDFQTMQVYLVIKAKKEDNVDNSEHSVFG